METSLMLSSSRCVSPQAMQPPQTRFRIAVIEDSKFWQYQIRQNLKAIDRRLDVKLLSSAEELYEQDIGPEEFDLIISDHFLGDGKTGLSLWRDLRSQNCKVPFALTSGISDGQFATLTDSDEEDFVFIEKPYQFRDFKVQIDTLLKISPEMPVSMVKKSERSGTNGVGLLFAVVICVEILYMSFDLSGVRFGELMTPALPELSSVPKRNIEIPKFVRVPVAQVEMKKADSQPRPVGFHLQQGLKNQVARILSRAGDINRMVAERRVSAEEL